MAVKMTPIGELRRDLDRIAKTLPREMVSPFQKKVALQTLSGVVNKTPVDRGHARANWQVSVGSPPDDVVPAPRGENKAGTTQQGENAGRRAVKKGQTKILGARDFDVIWIANNLPYVVVLDQGGFEPPDPGPSKDRRRTRKGRVLVKGGYSVQAPNGMVDVTLEEIRSQFI